MLRARRRLGDYSQASDLHGYKDWILSAAAQRLEVRIAVLIERNDLAVNDHVAAAFLYRGVTVESKEPSYRRGRGGSPCGP